MLALDGVCAVSKEGCVRFLSLAPPSEAEVARVAGRSAGRIAGLHERRSLGPPGNSDEMDPLLCNQSLLAELYGASVSGRIATGRRASRRVNLWRLYI